METQSGSAARLSRRQLFGAAGKLGLAAAATSLVPRAMADHGGDDNRPSAGDIAILRFLAAAELIETDFWQQYSAIVASNDRFAEALSTLDEDMPTYVDQNTADELAHATFINGYLQSIGAPPVDLTPFRTLPAPPGDNQATRITNLRHLTIDTSFWNRYVSTGNPDLGDTFPQIVDIVNRPTVPLSNNLTDNQMLGIAFSAGFHFPSIEQGGASLYTGLLSFVSSPEVLAIVASIGPTEMAHYMIWRDKVGNVTAVDTGDGLVFPDISSDPNHNQVMPKPCHFLRQSLPLCSIVRPIRKVNAGAVAAANFLTNSGLFTGQSQNFFNTLFRLARAADRAQRGREEAAAQNLDSTIEPFVQETPQ